jgi:hypothetical protein
MTNTMMIEPVWPYILSVSAILLLIALLLDRANI